MYLLYSAPLKRFRGFLHTLHSDKFCLLVSLSLFLEGDPGSEMLLSVPPISGCKWLTDTCSIKDVPCLWKYHHSNTSSPDRELGLGPAALGASQCPQEKEASLSMLTYALRSRDASLLRGFPLPHGGPSSSFLDSPFLSGLRHSPGASLRGNRRFLY